MAHFIVKDSAAQMPAACWGRYRRVAVLEVEDRVKDDRDVKAISENARGVLRVVETWERLRDGSTERCAFMRALREAQEVAATLNAARGTS